jgi:Set1/Ash2 histone methyltransferase complex subunit ASH2
MTVNNPVPSETSSNDDERGKKTGKKKIRAKKLPDKPMDSLPQVCLSVRFKDKRIKLADDRLSAIGDRGYTTILATHGALRGKWYYEVTFENPTEPEALEAHVRLGWATRRTRYDMPIGCDIFSYGIRDIDGAKIVQGCLFEYGKSFKAGDVVGCLLSLSDEGNNAAAIDYEDPVWLPGLLCDPQYPPTPSQLIGSTISWSINGQVLGAAFTDVVDGPYYPAMSLFMKARIKANFGPQFVNQPEGFKAVCELFDPESHLRPPRRPPTFVPRGLLDQQPK